MISQRPRIRLVQHVLYPSDHLPEFLVVNPPSSLHPVQTQIRVTQNLYSLFVLPCGIPSPLLFSFLHFPLPSFVFIWSMLFWMFLRVFSRNFSNLLRLPTIFDIHSILSTSGPSWDELLQLFFFSSCHGSFNPGSWHKWIFVPSTQNWHVSECSSSFCPSSLSSFLSETFSLQFQIRCRTKHSMSPLPSMNLCLALLI